MSPSKSTELCSSAAVALCHKVNLQRCEVNLSSCVARRPLCHKVNLARCEAGTSAILESLKSTRSTKLLEKLLTWAAHTFH